MGFRYTDDPVADHEAYEAELARLEEQVPVCDHCNIPVMEDFCYEVNEDRFICAECLDKHYRYEVEGRYLECIYCGKTIKDDYCYEDDNGELFCNKCVDMCFRREVVVE